VEDAIDIPHGFRNPEVVEQVELLVLGHRELMACVLREGPQRSAEHSGSAGDQQAHGPKP
jgi:hypothetical protein